MRICEKCEYKLGDDVKNCPFCGGATHPAPEPKKPAKKAKQAHAVCNVCKFKLAADVKKCPFCGGTVAVKAGGAADRPKSEYQLLQEKAAQMGLVVAPNIGKDKLKALIADTEKVLAEKAELENCSEEQLREAATAAGIELATDDNKAVIIEKIMEAAKDK